jgi:fructose-1-phosphate kinase PfkB-like protein
MDQEGIPAVVIDTVGAGDSFTAAFLIAAFIQNHHNFLPVSK